ncbi:hypothetical protein HGP28_02630 [Vibrio sp. SM6]|uniref:ImpA N-terminal domain-containing protein n=1 Tax=Vibrio agarilyticus TaxID=2726741 RepID=A0A7X8YFL1_9VIBR|nr:type VI secretion system ImpA family N-terminal domain-containing protein [Vibrio agarilyticus]NLS11784.1 hypothetical protein [Vibrio agarilyticus]
MDKFDTLLEPISGDNPTGMYLKENRTLFRRYRNEFNVAQSSFRQLVDVPDALDDAECVDTNAAHWATLSTSCFSCLQTESKDVEILCWLTVAQLFTPEPLVHLAMALKSMHAVCARYWDDLHPTLPEKKRKGTTEQEQALEIVEHRIKPLLQLVGDSAESGLLYRPLQMLPLIGDIDFGRFYRAEKDGTLNTLKEEATQALTQDKADVEARIVALGDSLTALTQLEALVAQKCADVNTAPISFRFVKHTIERLISALRYLIGDQFSHWPLDPPVMAEAQNVETEIVTELATPSTEMNLAATQAMASQDAQVVHSKGLSIATLEQANQSAFHHHAAIETRAQALAQLQTIANYFLTYEPHSPIYLLLKRAIRWGGMALPELLEELVGDNREVQQRIEQLAGLESAQDEGVNGAAPPPISLKPSPMVNKNDDHQSAVIALQESNTKEITTTQSADSGLANMEW